MFFCSVWSRPPFPNTNNLEEDKQNLPLSSIFYVYCNIFFSRLLQINSNWAVKKCKKRTKQRSFENIIFLAFKEDDLCYEYVASKFILCRFEKRKSLYQSKVSITIRLKIAFLLLLQGTSTLYSLSRNTWSQHRSQILYLYIYCL